MKDLQHELHHLWQSRSMTGNWFIANYAMSGLFSLIMGYSPIISPNYFESQAERSYWWNSY